MSNRRASQFAKPALTALLLGAVHPAAANVVDADDASIFSLRGFGTLGEVHSDARNADFVGNYFQPNGAGYARSWAPGVDSKLGLQVDAHPNDKLSAILQVVSQHSSDDKWIPQVWWANVKYQFTPDFSIRAGRTVADSLMLSDTRLVGYTYPWIRPPIEIYGEAPITNLDGIGFTYRIHIGRVTNSVSVTYGQASAKIPTGGEAKSAKRFFLYGDTLEAGPVTVRLGYESFLADVHAPSLDALFAGFAQFGDAANAFGFTSTGAQALALGDRYRFTGVHYSVTTIGANYDSGNWLLMSEWAKLDASGAIASNTAWYVTAGYRIGDVMPYLAFAHLRSDTKHESGISTAGLPPPLAAGAMALNAGLSGFINGFAYSQDSVSVGTRWDFMKNTDLKIQYDRLKLGANSSGRLGNVQPDFQPGATVNVFSIAVDFVF